MKKGRCDKSGVSMMASLIGRLLRSPTMNGKQQYNNITKTGKMIMGLALRNKTDA